MQHEGQIGDRKKLNIRKQKQVKKKLLYAEKKLYPKVKKNHIGVKIYLPRYKI